MSVCVRARVLHLPPALDFKDPKDRVLFIFKRRALGVVQIVVHKRGQQPVLHDTEFFMPHQMTHSKGIIVTSRDVPSLTQCPRTATL